MLFSQEETCMITLPVVLLKHLLLSFTVITLVACASSIAKKESFSGFLSDYSQLTKVKLASGEHTLRWLSPSLKDNTYSKIFIDPVIG